VVTWLPITLAALHSCTASRISAGSTPAGDDDTSPSPLWSTAFCVGTPTPLPGAI
jgi:hypothetical protein